MATANPQSDPTPTQRGPAPLVWTAIALLATALAVILVLRGTKSVQDAPAPATTEAPPTAR